MGNRVKRGEEEKKERKGRERERISDQPVITNRVLMFSLNGNAIVVLVSLEIYHRIGSLQTRHHIRERERERKEREREKGTLVLPFYS